MSLIAHRVDIIQSEPDGELRDCLAGFHRRCHAPRIHQVGMDHDHADYRTQEHIAAKCLCRTGGDQDRQKCKCSVGKHVENLIGIRICHCRKQGTEALQQAHQQTGCHDCRNDRYENIPQHLDRFLEQIHLLSGCRLDIFLCGGFNAGNGYEFLIDPIDNAGAENDLQLSLCDKYALDAFNFFDFFFANALFVFDNQSQTGGTMGTGNQVFLTADFFQHLYRCFMIIH